MPDEETATPNPAKTMKFANPGQVGALFPQLQSRCSVKKGLLNKGFNSLMKTSDEFSLASEEGSALTIQRKAKIFLDKFSAVSVRKNQLEDAFDKLVEHTYELNATDFEPLTAPQVMAEYLNKQMSELLNQADLTLTKYEAKIKEAETLMSRKEPPPTLPPPPPPASPINLQPTPKFSTPAMF